MFTIEPETPKSQAKELEKRKQSLEEQRRYHEQYLRYKSEKDQFLRKKPYSKSRITPALKQVLRGFGVVCFLVLVFVLVISLRRNFRHGFSENQKIIKDIKISEKQINKSSCVNTKQGKYYLTDQYGMVCSKLSINPKTGCCPKLNTTKFHQFSCHSCQMEDFCCSVYEFCVSCCMDPKHYKNSKNIESQNKKNIMKKFKICKESCRTSSQSIINENVYRSKYKYCFDLLVNSKTAKNRKKKKK
ncbi:hypothetical protein M0812_26132 [Anaeramoeba flamelloides]|uniref:SREBP regulating gene protein n=1 Tax=Anaeramoeba flamelloides TaxID=1746091 RepID=A0AAV7YDC8_9EUKA|nr:hypothetical protein M0812_26132 [Anaeramoeba flamelloides]